MLDLWPVVLAIVLLAYFVRSAFGFGDALVASSLLSLFLDLKEVTPFTGLTGVTATVILLFQERAHVEFRRILVLLGACALGIPVGIYLLKGPYDGPLKLLLGGFLLAFSLLNLTKPNLFALRTESSAPLFGFGAGVLGGALNTSGPLIVLYGLLRRWDRREMRANYQAFFMASGSIIVVGHGASGLWSAEILLAYLCCLPVLLFGMWAGRRFHRRLSDASYRNFVFFVLMLVGLVLMVRTMFFS